MKKLLFILIITSLLIPKNLSAQNNGTAAAAAGILAIGGAIAAVEQLKENLEKVAVEQVLKTYPDLIDFD